MGMFDRIYCECELPFSKKDKRTFQNVEDWSKVEFQTKHLDNGLYRFIIRKNKKLIREHVKYAPTVEEKPKDHVGFWLPCAQVISKSYKHHKHTGKVFFYTIQEDIHGNEWMLEFFVTFLDGVAVSKISKNEFSLWMTKEEVEERKKRVQEMYDQAQKKKGFFSRVWDYVKYHIFGYFHAWVKSFLK